MTVQDFDGYARLIVSSPPDTKTCCWCRSPFHKVRSGGLCGHCYGISRKVKVLEQEIQSVKSLKKNVPWDLHYQYQIAIEMENLAKQESLSFESDDPFHTGMRIERLMNYICEHWVGHSYYSQYASTFNHFLSPDQRRAIIHLLSRMIRDHLRKNRRNLAIERLADKEIYWLPPPPKLPKE